MEINMVYELRIDGTDNIAQAFSTLAKSLDALDTRLKQITQSIGGAAAAAKGLANQVSGVGNITGQGSRSGGPFSRVNAAQQRLQNARASGDPTAVADALHNLLQAQRSAARAQNAMAPNPLQNVMNLISTTRFGNGAVMPLVGRTLSAIGLGKMAGPIGLVVAGLTAMVVSIKAVVNAFAQMRNVFWKSGGNERGAAQVASIAAAANVDPEAAASIAGGMPGKSAEFVRKIQRMLRIRSDEAAKRFADQMGISDFLPLRHLEARQKEEALSGKNFGTSKANMRDVTQLFAEFNKFINNLKQIALASPLGLWRGIAPALKFVNAGLERFLKLLNDIKKWFQARGWWPQDKPKDESVNRFSDAVDRFSNAVGTFGGGERARNAYPAAYGWYGNEQALQNDSKYLGAFPL